MMKELHHTTLPYVIGLSLILLWATAFRFATLDRPFHYDFEATGSFYGVLAHNYFRSGWTETFGMPVLTVGRPPNAAITFYHDHPPVVPLLIYPFYKLFGFGEWQTRLATSIAAIAAIFALYKVLEQFGSRRVALISAACFAATPMYLYYGGQPEVTGMPLILFAICSVFAYLVFHRHQNVPSLALLIGTFVLAGATDWPAFILVPIFLVHFLATQPRSQWIWILAFCVASTAIFVLIYVYIKYAADVSWDWMLGPLLNRSGLSGKFEFTPTQWLATALKYNVILHTVPLLLASTVWLIGLSWCNQPGNTIARLLLAWGLAHVIIGRQGVYIHEWWWWPLTPGLAAASGIWLDWLLRKTQRLLNPGLMNAVFVLALLSFAAWNTQSSYSKLYRDQVGPFTTAELGDAIRAAAPQPDDVALLVWGGNNPQEYFYGNRPLRSGIWSVDTLQRRLCDTSVDLPFGYEQPWRGPATGVVFPLVFRHDYAGLLDYLQLHLQEVPLKETLAEKFLVFRLCSSCVGEPILNFQTLGPHP